MKPEVPLVSVVSSDMSVTSGDEVDTGEVSDENSVSSDVCSTEVRATSVDADLTSSVSSLGSTMYFPLV